MLGRVDKQNCWSMIFTENRLSTLRDHSIFGRIFHGKPVATFPENALAIAAALILATAPARAAEIDAMITTAMGSAIEQLAPAFERASGHTLRIVYGPSGGLARRLNGGEAADLVIVESKVLDELIKQARSRPSPTCHRAKP